VIEADSDLIVCRRDIALNPVRARMVPAAEEYRWSSDRCNALGLTDPVVGLDQDSGHLGSPGA
jgi:putative transposase